MMEVFMSMVHGAIAGAIYSLLGYLRNRGHMRLALSSEGSEGLDEETIREIIKLAEFDFPQFITTVIQGVIVGLVSWAFTLVGIPLSINAAYNILIQVGLLTLTRKIYRFVASMLQR
jgi:hypothetical protein